MLSNVLDSLQTKSGFIGGHNYNITWDRKISEGNF